MREGRIKEAKVRGRGRAAGRQAGRKSSPGRRERREEDMCVSM